MVNMTRAGEVGGFLDSVMLQIAENYEAEVKLRGKVKSAMTYPVVVFCIAILAVVGMLLFIVPVFAKMFMTLGGTLPFPTRVLIEMSHLLKIFAPLLARRVDRRHDRLAAGQAQGKASAPSSTRSSSKLAGLRQPLPEDRAQPLRPQPRDDAVLRRADPAEPRHRRRHDRKHGAGQRGQRRPGECPAR